MINNQVVAKSRKIQLTWPTFRCRFMQKYSVYVYSKPSSIKLQIMHATLFPKIIDTIEVEVPGEKSNAITSAGMVLKECYFANGRENIRKKRYAFLVK